MNCVFLDRDGVINQERGDYTYELHQFSWVKGIKEAIIEWKQKGYLVIVITNQGGIAKGLYDTDKVQFLHDFIQNEIIQEGGRIDAFYFCPHHHKVMNCLCRKPKSLMLEKAMSRFDLLPVNCVMIGDTPRDIKAAKRAGVKGIQIQPNQLPEDLLEQVDCVLNHE